ncbi:MAG: response regulator, partial [Flavobacteriaceae bacterium]|nr:response regulator [Flavobacteriaceae bacterium]
MNVIIIEDEKPAARRLNRLLEQHQVTVLALLHSVESSIAWLQENEHPDLIFLDIQLSDGLSFEIFEHLKTNSAIIFTTAYDEYALQAFKLKSIDYLLKPIDKEDLENAINQYKAFMPKQEETSISIKDIKKLLVQPETVRYKERFSVKVGQYIKLISVADVECFYAENKATYL